MDPTADEVLLDFPPFFRHYKSGRIERLAGTAVVPASVDPATGVASKDVPIDPATGVSARLYLPGSLPEGMKLPVLVYFHGGGFVIESASSPSYHHYLNSLASDAGLLVVSVDYRRAPEHKLPTAYDDSLAALRWAISPSADPWIADHGDLTRVFLAGDSAGANIAHNVAMRAGAEVEGVVLVQPFFWGTEPVGPETRDPVARGLLEGLWRLANHGGVGPDDPAINQLASSLLFQDEDRLDFIQRGWPFIGKVLRK